jgi:hypothetical protein
VTWDGVYSYGRPTPDTFQMQFDTATGSVRLCGGDLGLGGTWAECSAVRAAARTRSSFCRSDL